MKAQAVDPAQTHDAANLIGGSFQAAANGGTLDNTDPATGRVVGRVPRSQADDVFEAVAAARDALPAWQETPVEERCAVLERIADGIEAQMEALARMETQDSGKPIATSRAIDIPRAVRNLRFFSEFVRGHEDPEHPMEGGRNVTHRVPVGVAGLITPWNLPLYLLTWKVAPALAMGNTVVAKPSELTPSTATALGRIAQDAGLPSGVLNIVHGLGPEAGMAIVEHPDVAAVSFTGGTDTGRRVAKAAAPTFKRLSLELGGKNATIVYDDCDLDIAVQGAVRAGFTNTGQVCLCGSRILVQDGLHEAFLERLHAEVAALPVGDPNDPETRLGPLASHGQRQRVESYLEVARAEGATVTGGGRPDLPAPLDRGAFLEPAVITDVDQGSRCVQEEIFGPVVTVQSFHDEPDAIAFANDVSYGLSATVWTPDLEKARRTAEALECGMVWINDWLVRDLRTPFGGMKQSGVGREGGRWSLDFFSEARNIYWPE